MNDITDLLQIKIEQAKRELPLETINAINAVDWKAAIIGLRTKKGYNFEQLGDLELETELVLCGLANIEDYPRELEKRLKITRSQTDELVNEMNDLVFKKIMEELIKNTERKKVFQQNQQNQKNTDTPNTQNTQTPLSPRPNPIKTLNTQTNTNLPKIPTSTEMTPEKLEITGKVLPILNQKLSGSVKIPTVKTEHTLENITKTKTATPTSYPPKADPYRLAPEE